MNKLLLRLTQKPRLQNARIRIINCEVFLDQFPIEFSALRHRKPLPKWHLARSHEGFDDDVIHGPVESSEALVLMATGTRHGPRHDTPFEARAEALNAITQSR